MYLFTRLLASNCFLRASALGSYCQLATSNRKLLLVRDHPLHFVKIGIAHQGGGSQLFFALLGLRSQDVAEKRLAAFHLSRPGFLEAFGSAFMCFQFWHSNLSNLHLAIST